MFYIKTVERLKLTEPQKINYNNDDDDDERVGTNVIPFQVILAGTLTVVQGNISCKVLAGLSTVNNLSWNWPNRRP